MSRKWTTLLKIGLPVLLVAGLAAGLAGTALASPKAKNETVKAPMAGTVVTGNVTSKNGNSFVVQSANQTLTAVSVNATTKYFQVPRALPNRFGVMFQRMAGNQRLERPIVGDIGAMCKLSKNATFADLAIGDKVVVRLFAGSNVAREVLIVKPLAASPARNQTVTGTITLLTANATANGGLITITPTAGGAAILLTWDTNTSFLLKGLINVIQGQKVTAVYNPTTLKAITVRVPLP